jgi:hypothetical protein
MSEPYLATYLSDHLAGSVVAIKLLEDLEKSYADAVASDLGELKVDILEDIAELEGLMKRLGVSASLPRKAGAWLVEKAGELKMRWDDPEAGAPRLFQSLEILSIGIEGKRCLWLALSSASTDNAALRGPDYARLERRALDQRQRAETMRLQAAQSALRA